MPPVKYAAQARYDAQNVQYFSLKLNAKTDADIITVLNAKANKQQYLKTLIRADIAKRQDV